MNAALFNGGKVHLLADKVARCGVGKHSQRRQWQTEFCAVTCQRCLKLRLVDQRRVTPVANPSEVAREELK